MSSTYSGATFPKAFSDISKRFTEATTALEGGSCSLENHIAILTDIGSIEPSNELTELRE
jgi:hypothetical protein